MLCYLWSVCSLGLKKSVYIKLCNITFKLFKEWVSLHLGTCPANHFPTEVKLWLMSLKSRVAEDIFENSRSGQADQFGRSWSLYCTSVWRPQPCKEISGTGILWFWGLFLYNLFNGQTNKLPEERVAGVSSSISIHLLTGTCLPALAAQWTRGEYLLCPWHITRQTLAKGQLQAAHWHFYGNLRLCLRSAEIRCMQGAGKQGRNREFSDLLQGIQRVEEDAPRYRTCQVCAPITSEESWG